jgi:hypothetical protein
MAGNGGGELQVLGRSVWMSGCGGIKMYKNMVELLSGDEWSSTNCAKI